jgi:ABC-type multidrug transport system fused ATPase/permease subunit
MQETVRGIHVVQAFGREPVNRSQFRQVNEEWRQANVYSFGLGARFFPVVEFIGLLGTAIVLIYGGWRVIQGDLTVGVVAAFVLYLIVFVITVRVNVPLNNFIKGAGDPDRISDLSAVRERFDEDRWVRWNHVRTIATTIALGCLAWALVEYGNSVL